MPDDVEQISVYDRVAFPSQPFPLSRPSHVAVIAHLAGLCTPPPDRCRVLELGCGEGGNLIPLADLYPGSEFVGVDISPTQIAAGRRLIAELGLANIVLKAKDFADLEVASEPFDFIICHGVYSWTTDEAREQILKLCARQLADHGVAYVNYNTYPGWHLLGMLRDTLRRAAVQHQDPALRVRRARQVIGAMLEALPEPETPHTAYLRKGLELARSCSDAALFHAFLNVVNSPCYLRDFVERCEKRGLKYLGDADVQLMWGQRMPPRGSAGMESICSNSLDKEQLLDCLFDTTSRRSLLVRREASIRSDAPPTSLEGLHLAARPPKEPTRNLTDGPADAAARPPTDTAPLSCEPATRLAMLTLGEVWPESRPFTWLATHLQEKLGGQASSRAHPAPIGTPGWQNDLWHGFAAGSVELGVRSAPCTRTIGVRPRASELARLQARTSDSAINTRHRVVRLSSLHRCVLAHLDGHREANDLSQIVRIAIANGSLAAPHLPMGNEALDTAVSQCLEELAERSFLLAEEHR